MSLPESRMSRRTLLHAAGAVAVAGYVSSLASPAQAADASDSANQVAAAGLPDGLTVNNSTGVISGKPTDTGTSSVELSATNAVGTGTRTLTLVVG